jgi:hypothetical protein
MLDSEMIDIVYQSLAGVLTNTVANGRPAQIKPFLKKRKTHFISTIVMVDVLKKILMTAGL